PFRGRKASRPTMASAAAAGRPARGRGRRATGLSPLAAGTDTSARPVGLITAGSAFASAGVQRRVAEALERASRRRVVLLDAPVSARDAAVKDLAAPLIRENPSIVGYDWREPRCATGAGVLTAITRQVDAVYRV